MAVVGNEFLVSSNGTSWTSITSPWDAHAVPEFLGGISVTWADYTIGGTPVQTFAACMEAIESADVNYVILVSTDGITWTVPSSDFLKRSGLKIRAVPPGTALTSGHAGIVAVGDLEFGTSGDVAHSAYSEDADTYSDTGLSGSIFLSCVATDGTNWIIAAATNAGLTGHKKVWTSSTGESFGSAIDTAMVGDSGWITGHPNGIQDIAFGSSGRAIAVGTSLNYAIQTSDDQGATWAGRLSSSAGICLSVSESPDLGMWVAGSDNTAKWVYSTDDGDTWTSGAQTLAEFFVSLAWSHDLSLWVGVTPDHVYTSPDGVTWTERSTPWTANVHTYNDVCWSPLLGRFVITGGGEPTGGWVVGRIRGWS